MGEHNYDDVPVHVRTIHDDENDEHYVAIGVEVGGHFYAFQTLHLAAFEQVLDDLQAQASSGAEG